MDVSLSSESRSGRPFMRPVRARSPIEGSAEAVLGVRGRWQSRDEDASTRWVAIAVPLALAPAGHPVVHDVRCRRS